MARSRNIKPGFFLNDELAEIEPLGRLLFAGLWTVADREGRLRDSPKKIKACVLPYDSCDVDELLNELCQKRFIVRYTTENENYIAILNWKKHQNPHVKEGPSEIPGPTEEQLETKLALNERHTSTMQEQVLHRTSPADSLNLIPDSLNLIPLTLNPESGASTSSPSLGDSPKTDPLFEEFWDSYPRQINKTRAFKAWNARRKEKADPHDLILAARNYATTRQGKDQQYTQHPATFLGPSKPYEDYIKPQVVQEPIINPNRPKSYDAIDQWYEMTKGMTE